MGNWISVRERLPEVDRYGISEPVLMAISVEEDGEIKTSLKTGEYREIDGAWFYYGDDGYSKTQVNKFLAVTHWMLLPESPSDITPYDCLELCQWHLDGEPESCFNRGIYLTTTAISKLSCNNIDDGIPIQEIIDNLPLETGNAFREITNTLTKHPNKMERCEKWANVLDRFDKDIGKEDWSEFDPYYDRYASWREDWFNCVVLEGYTKNAMEKLFNMQIRWGQENGGGVFGIFGSHFHIDLEDSDWIDVFDFNNFLTISDNGQLLKLTLKSEDEDE